MSNHAHTAPTAPTSGRCTICETTVWSEVRGAGTRTRPGRPDSDGNWTHDDCRDGAAADNSTEAVTARRAMFAGFGWGVS